MRIVVCVKEVLDPDAVNNYALAGRLEIGDDGKSLTQAAIPRLMNGFDEQALEAALRIADAGADCSITVVSVGEGTGNILKHAAALGAHEIAAIEIDPADLDCHAVARLLAAFVRSRDGADLILCGRQASDDDQGVVPALIGELLDLPTVTIARAVEALPGSGWRVTRVTQDGDEVVEVSGAAVVTVSNELGEPRYPTAANKIKARRVKPTVLSGSDLGLSDGDLKPWVTFTKQFVPTIEGNCEFISEDTAAATADRLIAQLREDSVIQ
jgi:electron transfer flavoprotein beta subunit